MARTTVADVIVILPISTQLNDAQINAAIEAATCVVDQIANSCASHLSDACLERIEIYLSAHYCSATENTLSLTSEDDACSGNKANYGFKFGEGVKGTPYGQMANTLSGGCLAEMDKQPAFMFSLGCD